MAQHLSGHDVTNKYSKLKTQNSQIKIQISYSNLFATSLTESTADTV